MKDKSSNIRILLDIFPRPIHRGIFPTASSESKASRQCEQQLGIR
jgi:hypothetical protein